MGACGSFRTKKSHWLQMGFKMKQKANGDIDIYKMHIVLKGYSQVERRVDYKETFAPIERYISF